MRQRGFTLLEMLVVIGIFAMMYIVAVEFLSNALDSREQLAEGATEMENSQRAVTYLTLDFEQLISRPVRDGYGDYQPAMIGTEQYVEFTRLGWSNPFQLRRRSEMQRVIYVFENGTLYRRYWPVLDTTVATEYQEDVLIDNVKRFTVRYLDQNDQGEWQWLEFWPEPNVATQPVWLQRLPRSVEISVELESGDVLHRFFRTVVNPWA
ncbi:General secretion pathway protein J [Alloalcanivorax dieselolei B5]|uniref:Type II secretion system protein J n=1 Tax=Alcanivorax dieselolei (strain DSM 16502 / CGMCC 1.3690 / MCCC 1A00001 / B-5) TaxID=930169 RepID=K0CDI4_ALCDB|nr:type II secretion system minor pseudopilin GspJ [Alloalcanivorax dieselolei]AFT70490.1 General secretion pathway protein J [Alloalcanivorax dieselolei B5]GGJ84732.1 type II secretion system protein J [Alloalcanivorax dieselolei]